MMSNDADISVDDGETTVNLEGPFSPVPSYAVASGSNNINLNTSMMSNAANISVDDGGTTVDLEGTLKDLMNEIGSPAPLGRKSKVKRMKKKRVPLRTATPSVTYPAPEVPEVASPWASDMSMISNVDDDHTERLEGNLCDLVSSPQWLSLNLKSTGGGGADLMSAVGGGGGADMSVCSIMDRSMDTSTTRAGKLSTLEGMAMMRRLSVLNAGARINTLNQCGTPLAAKGSMSIGMKRHSLSVTQHLAQSNSKKHRASVSGPFRAARAALFAPPMHLSVPYESPSPPITACAAPVEAAVTFTPPPMHLSVPYESPAPPITACAAPVEEVVTCLNLQVPTPLESTIQEQFEEIDGECATTCPADIEVKANNLCAMRSGQEQEQEQEANAIIIACTAKKSKANLAGRTQLRDLRLKIEEAQRQLDSCEHTLHALQNEVSAILENKKDQAVSLLEQRVEEDKASAIRKDREAAEMEIMRNAAASELLCVERAYLSSKQDVGLLNRLTYCRVLSYLSTVIELEAVLSPKLRVQLLFHLSTDKKAGKLIVNGTHVDLKYADANPVSAVTNGTYSYSDRETVLADIFFSDVMCSDTVHGPLSEEFLSLVLCPADIPLVMRRVSHDLI